MTLLNSLFLVALVTIIHSINDSQASEMGRWDHNIMRLNRDATSGLIPFPRVGRSKVTISPFLAPLNFDNSRLLRFGPPVESEENPWNILSALLFQKREGLIPFPRVGRSGTGPKRNGAGTSGSLWFGPRLGKRAYIDLGGADNPTDSIPDYFNQNKVSADDMAVSAKAGELQ